MNKRQIKKFKKNKFAELINVVDENSILLFEYDSNNSSPKLLESIYNNYKNQTNCKIIFIPKDYIKFCENYKCKDNVIKHLEDIIKDLKES